MENDCQELIEDICSTYRDEFETLLSVPEKYGKQLEKLKGNISIVKKKVKETKILLGETQKDIKKIHYNCIFNKMVYKKLKEIELKLHYYEAASVALKNNQFLACSLNLQNLKESNSLLESTMNSRAETLSLRLLSRAIE